MFILSLSTGRFSLQNDVFLIPCETLAISNQHEGKPTLTRYFIFQFNDMDASGGQQNNQLRNQVLLPKTE